MAALVGNLACAESIMALKDLLDSLGVHSRDCRQEGMKGEVSAYAVIIYLTPPSPGIEQADICLLIGTNPRWEAALVNARLRKAWKSGRLKIYTIGNGYGIDLSCGIAGQ